MATSNSPRESGNSGTGSRLLLGLAGIVLCLVAVGVAVVTWSYLPPGHYPVIIAALPALPLVWAAYWFFKKAGWVQEPIKAQVDERSRASAQKGMPVGMGIFIIFAVVLTGIALLFFLKYVDRHGF